MTKTKTAVLLSLLLVVSATLLSACGGGGGGGDATAAGGGGDEPTTIKYLTIPGIFSPLEVADTLGYLGKLQIEETGTTPSGPESIQAVATNQTDTGFAFNGSIAGLIAAGGGVKAVVGAFGSDEKSYQGLYILDDSEIKTPQDLVGKKIGVNTLGGNFEAWIKIWLKEEGLTPDQIGEVEFVVIPPPNAEEALRKKSLDAVVLLGAIREQAEQKGGIAALATDSEVLGNYTGNSFVLRDDFIEEHPAATKELVAGIAKADKYLQDTPRAEVVKTLERSATEHGRPEEAATLKYWTSEGLAGEAGALTESDFSTWIEWLEEEGKLSSGKVSAKEAFTNEFNPYAKSAGSGGGGSGG